MTSSLSVSEGNITNVGSISCDSVTVDDSSIGLNISFGGATTTNKISLTDNLADALNITEGSNSYLKFVTTNSSEQIVFGKESTFSSNVGIGTTDPSTSLHISSTDALILPVGNLSLIHI